MDHLKKATTVPRKMIGWFIHLFTASGACVGLFSLFSIYQHHFILALWLMGIAIFIDAVDGMFARMIKIKQVVPEIDGALLDNIVDFLNYTIVPCFFLLVSDLLPHYLNFSCVTAIIFASAYQFTQVDAKTRDHFFKGFPSYWNIAVFYLFFWQMSPFANMFILFFLALLSFVPIKYVYPSRLDYLTNNRFLRSAMVVATVCWGIATLGLLWIYPKSNDFLVAISIGYILLYIAVSLYRTYIPLSHLIFAEDG